MSNCLNDGSLPNDYYAMSERGTERAVLDHPPRVKYTEEQERETYADSADRVAVDHANGDRVVAYIEIVSPGNKHGPLKIKKFVEKCNESLERGIHLLVIDILPPGKHDPHGIHAALWEYRYSESHGVTATEPLGISSYRVDEVPRAYFQPLAVGQPLPDMPVFISPLHYLNALLEQTYRDAYRGVPERWKRVIEGRE